MLEKSILNPAGADSMVVLKLSDEELCSEAHQWKRFFCASSLTTDAVRIERENAVDPEDYFIIICAGKLCGPLDQLPDRTAIVVTDCFEQYFGPYAGRACIYMHSGPLDINVASVFQLQHCVGLDRVTVKLIDEALQQEPFSDQADFKVITQNFSDANMEQFCF